MIDDNAKSKSKNKTSFEPHIEIIRFSPDRDIIVTSTQEEPEPTGPSRTETMEIKD